MKATIIKPGLLTTFQDTGRYGFQDSGVPISGAMDTLAARIANYLVGNEENATVLELTYGNFEMMTETDMLIAFSGGGVTINANNKALTLWKTYFIPSATKIEFNSAEDGCRCYIAIAGGWQADVTLNSSSTYLPARLGGINGMQITARSSISSNQKLSDLSKSILNYLRGFSVNSLSWGVMPQQLASYGAGIIRIIKHQEFEWFDLASQSAFFKEPYTPGRQSNRMGYQLTGPVLSLRERRQLLSAAVSKGTIQVTASGTPIILMSDAQTTGGYPRIAQVAAIDLPVCAQLKPGDVIRFKEITIQEAERLYIDQEKTLSALKETIRIRIQP